MQQVQVQVKEGRWAEKTPQEWRQPKRRRLDRHEDRGKIIEVHLAKWISVEHREEVHEKIQRKVRDLLSDSAQIEEEERRRRSSSTERPRKGGDLQRMQQESPMKEQAVRIVSTREVESSLQSIVTWE